MRDSVAFTPGDQQGARALQQPHERWLQWVTKYEVFYRQDGARAWRGRRFDGPADSRRQLRRPRGDWRAAARPLGRLQHGRRVYGWRARLALLQHRARYVMPRSCCNLALAP